MYQIRIHGRAGQGAKTIAQILAEAAIKENKFVQAFPFYGPARTGAPMNAFVRIDSRPITIHSEIKDPDAVLVIDSLLIKKENIALGLKKNGILIVNSNKSSREIKIILKQEKLLSQIKVLSLPASEIAKQEAGKDIANVVLIGALIRVTGLIKMENLIKAIEEKFKRKIEPTLLQANIRAIKSGYQYEEKNN